MGAARHGVKISCDQRGNIEGTKWNLIFSTLHCTPRRVAIGRNMSTAVLYNVYNERGVGRGGGGDEVSLKVLFLFS